MGVARNLRAAGGIVCQRKAVQAEAFTNRKSCDRNHSGNSRAHLHIENMILNLGGCHVESKNSGERASGVRNHTRHVYLGLFVRRNSGLSQV